jgi:hypothetical protein
MDVRSHVPSMSAYSALAPVGVLAGALAGRGVGGRGPARPLRPPPRPRLPTDDLRRPTTT